MRARPRPVLILFHARYSGILSSNSGGCSSERGRFYLRNRSETLRHATCDTLLDDEQSSALFAILISQRCFPHEGGYMIRKPIGRDLKLFFLQLVLIIGTIALAACGGGSSSSSPTPGGNGLMSVSLTDGPGDYDHVYITVKDVW